MIADHLHPNQYIPLHQQQSLTTVSCQTPQIQNQIQDSATSIQQLNTIASSLSIANLEQKTNHQQPDIFGLNHFRDLQDEQHEQQNDMKKSSQNQENSIKQYRTQQFVQVNKNQVKFCKQTLFPGSIQEVDLSIVLRQQMLNKFCNMESMLLRVVAKCSNDQFNDLDQYVFSVRSNQRFEYFEEVRFKINKKEKAQIKIAVKVPPILQNCLLNGILQIQLQNFTPIVLPISAKCQLPKILCIKNLYKAEEDTQLIKIPAKKSQARLPPIPFKNLSNFNFSLEIETISNKSFGSQPYDIVTQSFVNCQANSQFFVNIQLRENLNYQGIRPSRETFRKILILKTRNSSVLFHYPIQVHVFSSSNHSSTT